MEFVAKRPALQEMFKEVLQRGGKLNMSETQIYINQGRESEHE